MTKKTLKVGIMSQEDYKKRTIAIARGDYKPKRGEPRVWFPSLQSLAQVLSSENQELLRIIQKQKPRSLKELVTVTGRQVSNLSRTLHTMSRYGLVDLVKQKRAIKPIVKATNFKVEFDLYNTLHVA
jgi:predicted transcriptional regulator